MAEEKQISDAEIEATVRALREGGSSFESPSSSTIEKVWYDRHTKTMMVQFKKGCAYLYYGIQPELYDEFEKADSAGKFFAEHVKHNYDYPYVKAPEPKSETESSEPPPAAA